MVKKIGIVAFIIALSLKAFSQEAFYVYFMQNGKRINIEDAKVELKKQAFTLFTESTAPIDLFFHASSSPKIWNAAKKGKLLHFMPIFNPENMDNSGIFKDKDCLILKSETAFLWKKNQSDKSVHKTAQGRFVQQKNINKIYSTEDQAYIKLVDNNKSLFLVFMYAPEDKKGERFEIQREAVKIKWVNKYKEETKAYAREKRAEKKAQAQLHKQKLKKQKKAEKKEKAVLEKLEKEKKRKAAKEEKRKRKQKNKESVPQSM